MNVTIQVPQQAIRKMLELNIPLDRQADVFAAYLLDLVGMVDHSLEFKFNEWINKRYGKNN